ncbi:hypothetical protein K432DRAFT_384500 [Lepidopterella palustris CBS 459.81]|uniref:Uncharacterized protein n=1 Tax=Lepidopterella palustris CBS 459.81 TaxID=1314670 RepID=A0A8E2E5C4_9PEZI|nr:hypothetical protein K432DRAFT_384500 [Lepidopterella palustris CBS 459.81]
MPQRALQIDTIRPLSLSLTLYLSSVEFDSDSLITRLQIVLPGWTYLLVVLSVEITIATLQLRVHLSQLPL